MRTCPYVMIVLIGFTLMVHIGTFSSSDASSGNEEVMGFHVGGAFTDGKLEGVAVIVAGPEGRLMEVSHTNVLGQVSIPKDLLKQQGKTAILFCKERFFCGAFRLDDESFFDADSRLIHLAPFAVP